MFQRFWARYENEIDEQGEVVLARLLELEDHDLWALVSGREETDDQELSYLVKRLQDV